MRPDPAQTSPRMGGQGVTLARSIETIADPLYGLGSGAGELVVGYVDLLSTLTLLSDPSSGRSLDGSAKSRPHGSSRAIDRRSVWSGRRLDYELEDLSEVVTGLATFVASPREISKRNTTRLSKCPDCRKSLDRAWNVCPRCTYDLRRDSGRGPRCAIAGCAKAGRPRRHGAQHCDECGNPLLAEPGRR